MNPSPYPARALQSARIVLLQHDRSYSFVVKSAEGEKLLTSNTFDSVIQCVKSMMLFQSETPQEQLWERKTNLFGQHYFMIRDICGLQHARSSNYWSEAACEYALKTLLFETALAQICEGE